MDQFSNPSKSGTELKLLQIFAKIGKSLNNKDLEHLDAPMGAYNYIRMADLISKNLKENCATGQTINFLDWGAGYGQITWLLRERGLNATGYNVEERKHLKNIQELANLPMIYGDDPVKLPFKDNSFEGVSSCGVLEHVPHPNASLKEICRILKPGGFFHIFMLPQKTAWVEILGDLRGHSVHPVKYTMSGIEKMLTDNGFSVKSLWKFNLIPKNLTGLPPKIKRLYGNFYRVLYPLDALLSKIPLLNLLSGVIEGIAQKKA